MHTTQQMGLVIGVIISFAPNCITINLINSSTGNARVILEREKKMFGYL